MSPNAHNMRPINFTASRMAAPRRCEAVPEHARRGLSSGLRSASLALRGEHLRCACTASAGKNLPSSDQGGFAAHGGLAFQRAHNPCAKYSSPPTEPACPGSRVAPSKPAQAHGEHLRAGLLAERSSPDSSELALRFLTLPQPLGAKEPPRGNPWRENRLHPTRAGRAGHQAEVCDIFENKESLLRDPAGKRRSHPLHNCRTRSPERASLPSQTNYEPRRPGSDRDKPGQNHNAGWRCSARDRAHAPDSPARPDNPAAYAPPAPIPAVKTRKDFRQSHISQAQRAPL